MTSRCLLCHKAFRPNRTFPHFAASRRIAYDPVRGRLWAICESCRRWTLCPIEDRDTALYELEKAFRDQARVVTSTANISLLEAGDCLVVRVGRAQLDEQAWWRYGRELARRKTSFESRRSRLTAYAFGALHLASRVVGMHDDALSVTWDDEPVLDILRWRRFGWAAWHGRARCPYCKSTLRALRYDMSWWIYPLRGEDGSVQIGVPCTRCDPWTPDNVYRIGGPQAASALRRCLAYQNLSGAGNDLIRHAVRAIEDAGSSDAFTGEAIERRQSLWKMGPLGAVALEIALSESVEDRQLELEARALEAMWREEEELARIIDEELTPRRLLEEHLRKLPVRLVPRGNLVEP
jgi:hypothetical protein